MPISCRCCSNTVAHILRRFQTSLGPGFRVTSSMRVRAHRMGLWIIY